MLAAPAHARHIDLPACLLRMLRARTPLQRPPSAAPPPPPLPSSRPELRGIAPARRPGRGGEGRGRAGGQGLSSFCLTAHAERRRCRAGGAGAAPREQQRGAARGAGWGVGKERGTPRPRARAPTHLPGGRAAPPPPPPQEAVTPPRPSATAAGGAGGTGRPGGTGASPPPSRLLTCGAAGHGSPPVDPGSDLNGKTRQRMREGCASVPCVLPGVSRRESRASLQISGRKAVQQGSCDYKYVQVLKCSFTSPGALWLYYS